MLNIIKLKKKIINLKVIKSEGESVGNTRYYPPAVQEWKDSIYCFNKNSEKLIPVANNHIFNFIKSYFNIYSIHLEKKLKIRRLRRWKRRLSGNKIWISKPQLKHFNDKIIINLYIYNRQHTIIFKKLSKLKILWKKIKFFHRSRFWYMFKWIRLSKKIEKKATKLMYIWVWANILTKISNKNKILGKLANSTKRYILKNSYLNLYKKIYLCEILFFKNKQMLILNKLKFKSIFLVKIKNLIQAIYKKNIVFNIILLKTFNLDSHIFAQIVTTKIKYRKNKPLKVVRTSIRKSKVQNFNKNLLKNERKELIDEQNFIIKNFIQNLNLCNDYLTNIFSNQLYNPDIKNMVLSSTQNKTIIGIKIQASGRITRRLIAQRATSKIRYKGTLKNIDSSYRRLSTVILKGYEKSTLQYTQLYSKRRIGSFGLKGWINTN